MDMRALGAGTSAANVFDPCDNRLLADLNFVLRQESNTLTIVRDRRSHALASAALVVLAAPAPVPRTRAAEANVSAYEVNSDDATPASRHAVPIDPIDVWGTRPTKRRKTAGWIQPGSTSQSTATSDVISSQVESQATCVSQRQKRVSDNPSVQPSTLDKLVSGVWASIYGGIKLDPVEVIGQWQAIESSGRPKLLMDTASEDFQGANVAGMFERMSLLTRRISQTSRTCRSLEVIVQAYWMRCFDDHVAELALATTREKAKKRAMSQACADFKWSDKELRNKMSVWRGYYDIQQSGGWVALVFAGMGLYRFCKYRVSFNDEAFQTLRALRHRWEVAADTIHPHWRQLLRIIGGSIERRYTGHPHDWVVGSPSDEAIPLAPTYYQWDPDFSYTHLFESIVDEDVWCDFDPRTVTTKEAQDALKCQSCGEHQSDESAHNNCLCFPNLYSSAKAAFLPVQVFRTPTGKNNGLIACMSFEPGIAIGEFIGEVTAGLVNVDVMIGQTEKATYQISQRRQGNHLRFVNHSCQPNSQYERFVWLGKQRIVLVSRGVEAGNEITVDYSDTYWRHLDKVCLCGKPTCRYKERDRDLLTPPESE
ncbi:hypothetical protein B0A50_06740 [Salinomyces thailandicus]|uniref:SET domain-containing protein n=1 Tax=Salinomyces thailandicus TaxID=706561 RepID=A0A4U0TQR4_9PEZI|nr:hypothetical protein B0A50_06740 [Salinomyces thailandica]